MDRRDEWARFLSRDPAVAMTMQPYAYAGNDPVNFSDPLGLWPWDGKCITLFDDNCVSIAEQHPEVTQGVVDFASGVLEVNPITATTNALGWSDTSQYANEGSGTFNAGMLSMATFNAAYVYVSPGTATALAWHGGGMAGINCARQGLGSMACQYGAFTSVVGAHSVLGNWFDMPSVRSFYNMLAALMGGAPVGEGC